MSHCHSCGGVIGRDCWNPQECAEITGRMAMEGRQSDPAPSPTNTAGLENAGHIVRLKDGGVRYCPEGEPFTISESCRVEPLVTAASAQARIAELEAEVEAHRSGAWILAETKRAQAAEARVAELEAVKWEAQHADTMNDLVAMGLARDAAEARADRLADGITAAMLILTPEPGDKSLTEREKTARQLLAALQDQPK